MVLTWLTAAVSIDRDGSQPVDGRVLLEELRLARLCGHERIGELSGNVRWRRHASLESPPAEWQH